MSKTRNREAFIATLNLSKAQIEKVFNIWTKYEQELAASKRNNGAAWTLDRYKSSYAFLRNKILKLNAPPIQWCKADSDGYPKTLWSLRPLLKGNRNLQRVALTIARSYEVITLPIDYHPESIQEPSHYGSEFEETTVDFKMWLMVFTCKYPKYLGSLHLRDSYEPRVFTTLSKGPNGPAVSCSHLDAVAVCKDPTLFKHIENLNVALKQQWITQWMLNMKEAYNGKDKEFLTGRLGFSPEPAGKTRVFAIADYWSQTSLKVVQESLYNTLRSISTDSTADQDKGFKSLLKRAAGKPTYCFDLTAASDRIPAFMQKFRIDLLGGKKLGEAWLGVMTERDFYVKATKQKLRWSVGQPLGLLSSFPSFALWHHDIIQFAHSRVRKRKGLNPIKFFHDYALLGDDVVIFNTEVADEYRFLISEVYGIAINLSKSVIGSNDGSQIEFTKRLALQGQEMSSIRHNILSKKKLVNQLDLIDILIERDFSPSNSVGHQLYSFLSPEEQLQFSFMFWVRSSCRDPFNWVNPPLNIERDDFEHKLKEVRSQNLMNKTLLIDGYLNRAKPLDVLYEKHAIPCDRKALGVEGYESNNLKLHPIVWAINQTGLDLSIALSTIWDEVAQSVSPVEYLPIVDLTSYYSNRKTVGEYLSTSIISVLNDLIKDTTSKSVLSDHKE